MTFDRKTLAEQVAFQGLGLHTGCDVKVVVKPGNEGIRFRHGSAVWQAVPENVTDTTRSTKLGDIGTVEHLMSALAGLEITDAEIEVDAPELPALDGAAREFVEGLQAGGTEPLGQARVEGPFARVYAHDEDSKIAISSGSGHWRYEFICLGRWPQRLEYETQDVAADYADEISRARTFGFEEEVEEVLSAGLAKGLHEGNALILGSGGYVNGALFEDEPPRHKLLDAIGDVYLAGIPIRLLNVVAERTGHRVNVEAAHLLSQGALVAAI